MALTERQLNILKAIVESYIVMAEPIGSKLISEKGDIRVSSATIRSEMATLFDMGYLEQPHTSAGRIPSHIGYREYLDNLIRIRPLSKKEKLEIDSLFNVKNPDPDKFLGDVAKALSYYTASTAVASYKVDSDVIVKKIELVRAGKNTLVILLIASNGFIRHKICRVDFVITDELIEFFTKFANANFSGYSIYTITENYVGSVSVTLGEYSRIFNPLLVSLFDLCREITEGQYYIEGKTKLLEYPELENSSKDLLIMLEDREIIHSLFSSRDIKDIRVIIGKENSKMELSRTSIVMSNYTVAGKRAGTLGIIGPIRTNYGKVIAYIDYFTKMVGDLLSDTLENHAEENSAQT